MNMIGNLYDTKRSLQGRTCIPCCGSLPCSSGTSSFAHGYGQKGAYAHGYCPIFNNGREVAYNPGDMIYPDRIHGNAVDGDHDRYTLPTLVILLMALVT